MVAFLMPSLRPAEPPRSPSSGFALAQGWIEAGQLPNRHAGRNHDSNWQVVVDDDETICLLPRNTPAAPLAIMPDDDGYMVLVCRSGQTDEIGPFPTVYGALVGIRARLLLQQSQSD